MTAMPGDPVTSLAGTAHEPDTQALSAALVDLGSSVDAFLQKYQPLSAAASNFIESKNADFFPLARYYFSDYPYFLVARAVVAAMSSPPGDRD